MKFLIFTLLFSLVYCGSKKPTSEELKCAVCRSLVEEVMTRIEAADPEKKVDLGFNIYVNGEKRSNFITYKGSEIQLFEIAEDVCDKFNDYAQGRHKETDSIETIKLVVDGKMNPNFDKYELLPDPEINKSLIHHCKGILSEHEENYLFYFSKKDHSNVEDAKIEFCSYAAKVCPHEKEEL